MTASAEVPALNRALVMVARTEVIGLSRTTSERSQRAVGLLEHGPGHTVAKSAIETTEVGRTYAVDSGCSTKRTGTGIAVRAQKLFLILITAEDSDVASSV